MFVGQDGNFMRLNWDFFSPETPRSVNNRISAAFVEEPIQYMNNQILTEKKDSRCQTKYETLNTV